MDIQRGDLVRWIIDYKVWEPPSGSDAFPVEPVYAYGIVIEGSFADPNNVVGACFANCHSKASDKIGPTGFLRGDKVG